MQCWEAISFGEGVHGFGSGGIEGRSVVLSDDFCVGLLSLHSSIIYRRLIINSPSSNQKLNLLLDVMVLNSFIFFEKVETSRFFI